MTEVVEEPVKKKRGRPRKENPYRDFQSYVQLVRIYNGLWKGARLV